MMLLLPVYFGNNHSTPQFIHLFFLFIIDCTGCDSQALGQKWESLMNTKEKDIASSKKVGTPIVLVYVGLSQF